MAMRFEGGFLELKRIQQVANRWEYRFSKWPDRAIFRRLVDFDQEVANAETVKPTSLGAFLKGFLK